MRRVDDTKTEGLSGAPLFGPSENYIGVVTNACSVVADESGSSVGLALLGWGEGGPASAHPAKDARSAGDPFVLAAVLCGHDPLTVVGAADARRDHRVWDVLELGAGR